MVTCSDHSWLIVWEHYKSKPPQCPYIRKCIDFALVRKVVTYWIRVYAVQSETPDAPTNIECCSVSPVGLQMLIFNRLGKSKSASAHYCGTVVQKTAMCETARYVIAQMRWSFVADHYLSSRRKIQYTI